VRRGEPGLRWMLSHIGRTSGFRRAVVVADTLADYLTGEHGIPTGKILVAPNAASEPRSGEPVPGLDPTRLNAGYVGGLRAGKGMELIAALAPLTPGVHYHIVGGDAAEVTMWQERLGGADNVTFHGRVPPGVAGRYRLSFDVLLAPYQRMGPNRPMRRRRSGSHRSRSWSTWPPANDRVQRLAPYGTLATAERLCHSDDVRSWRLAINAAGDPGLRSQQEHARRVHEYRPPRAGGSWKAFVSGAARLRRTSSSWAPHWNHDAVRPLQQHRRCFCRSTKIDVLQP
jgi:hypothetical protein